MTETDEPGDYVFGAKGDRSFSVTLGGSGSFDSVVSKLSGFMIDNVSLTMAGSNFFQPFLATIPGEMYKATGSFTPGTYFVNVDVNSFGTTKYSGGFTSKPVSPIPEPETYALMLAGLAAVGFVSRRRKAD